MDNRIGNNTSFGTLYMPSQKQLTRAFGDYRATKILKAKKELEQVARDVDVHVIPSKYSFDRADKDTWGLDVVVNKKCPKMFSKIYAFFEKYNILPNSKSDFVFIDKHGYLPHELAVAARQLRAKVLD